MAENMFRFLTLICLLSCVCTASGATITPEEVIASAEHHYRTRIEEVQSRYQLDNDPTFVARVQRIAAVLITQAKNDHPQASMYAWEIHVTDDVEESASCMAGGKMLVGESYVKKMELTDAELAMLLSHEIQHAVLEHHFKEFQEALRLDPVRKMMQFSELENAIDHDDDLIAELRPLDREQEREADQEGLRMAWRSGWPASALAGYFKKLARADFMANADQGDHPSSARRWQEMRQLAEELTRQSPEKMHP